MSGSTEEMLPRLEVDDVDIMLVMLFFRLLGIVDRSDDLVVC